MNPIWILGGLAGFAALLVNWDKVAGEPLTVLPENALELEAGTAWYLLLNFEDRLPGSAQALATDLAKLLDGLGLTPNYIRVLTNADGEAQNRTFQLLVSVRAKASIVTNRWFSIRTPAGTSLRARITRAAPYVPGTGAAEEILREVQAQPGVVLIDD